MKLYEHEAKELLRGGLVALPTSLFISDPKKFAWTLSAGSEIYCKAQVLAGNRMREGGIIVTQGEAGARNAVEKLCASSIAGSKPAGVLLEEKVFYSSPEYYLSFVADTGRRQVVCTYSSHGGTGIEERAVQTFVISQREPIFLKLPIPDEVLQNLLEVFRKNDCTLLEVNPLVWVEQAKAWYALDAKVAIDDNALARHPEFTFTPRLSLPSAKVNAREQQAKFIDEGDHRGVAGSAYVELDGDIGMLPSGGGASLLAMDALYRAGGVPANYTEYSGNPSGEKVAKLVAIVVSKPGLSALWVVGAIANFTDIYETLSGFIVGLRKARDEFSIKIDYPIVIRRGGPRDNEAYAMLRSITDFNIVVTGEETSIEDSAKQVVALAHEYKTQTLHTR